MSPGAVDVNFSGSIPENYHRYLGPLLFEWSAADLAARVAALKPARVLEIAAGTGILTRHLAGALDGAEIVATDLNQPMLDHAAALNGDLPGVSYRQADALDLPFDPGGFDAVVCQYGIMFFPDKAQGMAEMARVLRPGGAVALNVWRSHDDNPAPGIVNRVVQSYFEEDPPRFLEAPFSMSDEAEVRALFDGAGLADVEATLVRQSATAPYLDAARGFIAGNPTINEINVRATVDANVVMEAAAAALAAEFGDDPAPMPFAEVVYTGVKPA